MKDISEDMFLNTQGAMSGRVVTLSPPTCEARVQFPALPQVGKLVVACRLRQFLQYRTLANCMYWFHLPLELPIVI